jgi:hypothetical protein
MTGGGEGLQGAKREQACWAAGAAGAANPEEVQEIAVRRVVHEHPVADGGDELRAVRPEADLVHDARDAVKSVRTRLIARRTCETDMRDGRARRRFNVM